MLDSRSLQMFIALTEDLHFGRTADRLGIAQSALSRHIKRIEDVLGTTLLSRRKRARVSLTRAGSTFLKEAQSAIDQLARAEQIGRLSGRGAAGPISLGYVFSAAICGLLSKVFYVTHNILPDLEVRAAMMNTPEQLAGIVNGSLDFGFTRPRSEYPAALTMDVVHEEEVVLAFGARSSLNALDEIQPGDLGDHSFIIPQFSDGPILVESYRRLARAGGFLNKETISVPDFVTAVTMAAGGYGVVLAPRSLMNLNLAGVEYRKIADYHDFIQLILAYRSDNPSPFVSTFIDAFKHLDPASLLQPAPRTALTDQAGISPSFFAA